MSLEQMIMRSLNVEDGEEVRALTITWTWPDPPALDAQVRSADGTRTERRQTALRAEDQTNDPR
jgi:hypothetical protein